MLFNGLTEEQVKDLYDNLSHEELVDLWVASCEEEREREALMAYIKLITGVVVIFGLILLV